MPAKKELSLLPDSENANSLTAKVLRYITTVGRVIIIFTELIVITAFLSRFWLDRKNSDLSEVIRQQKAILESTQEFENEYALLQQRLKIIKDNHTLRAKAGSTGINTLTDSTPPDIIYDSINIENYTEPLAFDLTVHTFSEDAIVNFATNLLLNPEVKNVDIKKIEKKPKDNKYILSLHVALKPKQP